jgi:prepilin signal peptidase PulO-like enzyme (type II secretory pathway)
MTAFLIIFLGIVGAAMGSFVGALTYRLKHHLNFVTGRSECEHCHHILSALDLVPIVSWLVLRGKCRYCHKKIGSLTFWLECGMATVFILSFLVWPGGWSTAGIAKFVLWLILAVLLLALAVYDARWSILPNCLMLPAVIIAAAGWLVGNWPLILTRPLSALGGLLLAMLPVAGVYGILSLGSHGKLAGLGDAKLGIVVGFLLPLTGGIIVLFGANILGVIVALPSLLSKKRRLSSQIPFGPMLITMTALVFLFGAPWIAWLHQLIFLV